MSALLSEPQRDRLGRNSLTARIVSGVVALVVVLVVAIGGATYFALHSYLYGRLDVQVATAAADNVGFFERCRETTVPTPSGLQCDPGPLTQQEWVSAVIVSTRHVVKFSGEKVEPLTLTPAQAEQVIQDPNHLLTVTVRGVVVRAAAHTADPGVILLTGLSTAEVAHTLRRVVFLELFIGGGAALLAVLATSWGVRRSLRHLYLVTGTAREVAAELSPEGRGLDRRVPVTEEGTEVAQLAESMNTLLGAVETQFAARLESEQRMRQFLADASHELRTPLTSIRGYAELARMQRAAGETAADNLARIESEGTRMSRLVEDLLLLARGDADAPAALASEPVDVGRVVDDAASNARAAYPDRIIHAQVAGSPVVPGDRDQLLRIVTNLVSNAAVHTDPARPITIRSYVQPPGPHGPAAVVVQVVDGGPGLPPEQAAHVFERFWRADKARARASGGSGLGLSIVAALVRAHGGTVRFDSTVEGGSTVTVRLPAAVVPEAVPAS